MCDIDDYEPLLREALQICEDIDALLRNVTQRILAERTLSK